jgi:hypothetical protein
MRRIYSVFTILLLIGLISCKTYWDVEKSNPNHDKLVDNKKIGLWTEYDFGKLTDSYGYYTNDSLRYSFSIYQGKTIYITDRFARIVLHNGDTINDSRTKDRLTLKYIYSFVPKEYKSYYMISTNAINDSISERQIFFNKNNGLTSIADKIKDNYIIQYHFDRTSKMGINLNIKKDKHIVITDKTKITMSEYKDSICYKINN